jgi:hypothetical protein
MLKSSARLDANIPSIIAKKPVMLWQLMLLFTKLFRKSNFDSALADLCILSFWGQARLSELTYTTGSGPLRYDCSVLSTDVVSGNSKLGKVLRISL